ncbi:MAG: purine-binding chemotaxis protein CheW [Lachnospiraceae bacterium]|nr:purine-binding chemotaxis protein CheW [Lachnospiraceae bacterium]
MVMDNKLIGTDTTQYIVVKMGVEQYGIDIKYVDNIVRMQKITRVPKAQKWFDGVINLRGEIIPVMNLRRKFELEEVENTDKTRIIVLKPDNQGSIGVIVDRVKEVVTLGSESIEKAQTDMKDEKSKYISSVGKQGDELITILNINGVLDIN